MDPCNPCNLPVLCPRPLGGGNKRWCCLTSVCLSVAYIGNNSRTDMPRKIKLGTQVTHVTRDSDSTFKVKRSKVNLQGRGNIVADSRTSLIFIKSLIFMALLEARRAGHRRRKGWTAAGPQRPAYSGRGLLCRHAHSLFDFKFSFHYQVMPCPTLCCNDAVYFLTIIIFL